MGTTVLTARREGPTQVRIMTRRGTLDVNDLLAPLGLAGESTTGLLARVNR